MDKTVKLANGVQMPVLGYGVYQVTKDECERCVLDALEAGYRSIDTAQAYKNEEEVGSALEKSGVARKDVFLTSKVWCDRFSEEDARKSVMESLEKLRTDYIDLMLLHQPFGDVYGAWRALEKLYREGKLRAIGVSNFYPDRLVDFASFNNIAPMVNQIEIHPHCQRDEDLRWMKKYNIAPEAWAPFGEGRGGLFEDAALKTIGAKYGKTAAQVMLRWNLQRGVIVIPKSVHKERMIENLAVFDFELGEDDMTAIGALDKGESAFFSHEDPATVEMFAGWLKGQH